MNRIKSRPVALLIVVLLLALMGCSTKSPTEPSTGGNGGNCGSTPPPSGATSIVLTASNPTPVRGSSSVVSAAVTIGGQPAVNGTAVEFSTNFGTFNETGTDSALRTTTNGVATVTVTSATVGVAQVTARIGTVSKTVSVNFRDDTGTVGDAPTIVAVNPSSGPPAGNQAVTITGTHLKSPVRVFFGAKEAVVLSATETEIRVLSPAVNLGAAEQSLTVDVKVITKSGASDETSVTLAGGYRYEREILTPIFNGLSPVSGPNEGNTRITIVGEGFQSPCRVFFGTSGGSGGLSNQVELEVVSVSFAQIVAITPPAAGLGSAFLNAQVTMRIQNVASNKEVVVNNAFRYGPKIQITAISPTQGSYLGGTRVTINGFGFDDPVAVTLGGIPAQVVRVSGTEIVVLSGAPLIQGCAISGGGGGGGGTSVTNIEDGQSADSPTDYTYIVNKPSITGVSPNPVLEGNSVFVTVLDPGSGAFSFKIGTKTVFPTASVPSPPASIGQTVFQMVVPTGLTFDTKDCTTAGGAPGTQNVVTAFDVAVNNISTGCTASITDGINVTPADTSCQAGAVAAVSPSSITFPSTAVGATSAPVTVTIRNIGSINMTILSISATGPFASTNPASTTVVPNGSQTIDVTFSPTASGAVSGSLLISTTGGDLTVTLSGTAP